MNAADRNDAAQPLQIGWAQADITPEETVLICGQFYARLSEKVLDPVTATALVLSSGDEHAVLVSCDLIAVPDPFRDAVRDRLRDVDVLDPQKVALSGTHTHTGPEVRLPSWASGIPARDLGIELKQPVMDVDAYQTWAAERIAAAVRQAWATRAAGAVAFGHGWAVVGHNRRWVDLDGQAAMYHGTDSPGFSHIEGYEDHSLGVVATYNAAGALTGLVVNAACPSQCSEHEFALSADYWCETRAELRNRFGSDLFILPQCSAAGDQAPRMIYAKPGEQRMHELKGGSQRQEIACRIARAVDDVLPAIAPTADATPPMVHRVEGVELPVNALAEQDVETALAGAAECRALYDEAMRKLENDPALRDDPRWYKEPTTWYRRMRWFEGVAERFEKQKTQPMQQVELHVLRLGDLALATNPFEFYLDFGIRIKARSPAVETLLVQLTGGGTYCPSPRSLAGGGYGSLPASNPVGPEGGRVLVERTVEVLESLWPERTQKTE